MSHSLHAVLTADERHERRHHRRQRPTTRRTGTTYGVLRAELLAS